MKDIGGQSEDALSLQVTTYILPNVFIIESTTVFIFTIVYIEIGHFLGKP